MFDKRLRLAGCAGAIASFVALYPALGRDQLYWNYVGTDSWHSLSPLRWSNVDPFGQDHVPTSSDDAYIYNGGTGQIPAGVYANAFQLHLGKDPSSDAHGSGTVQMLGGPLTIQDECAVGQSGIGAIQMQTGALGATTLTVGSSWGDLGTIELNPQATQPAPDVNVSLDACIGLEGNAAVKHVRGTVSTGFKFWIGAQQDASGIYELSGTANVPNRYDLSGLSYFHVGGSGCGILTQTHPGGKVLASGAGGQEYPVCSIGLDRGCGRYIQTGPGCMFDVGVYDSYGVSMARGADSRAEYRLTNGAFLNVKSDPNVLIRAPFNAQYQYHDVGLVLGGGASGTQTGGIAFFFLGDAATTGNITGGPDATELTVRMVEPAGATFRGWGIVGTVNKAKALTNNGQVIADGYGLDRSLDMWRFADWQIPGTNTFLPAVINKWENPTDRTGIYGWYAQNRGELVLPALSSAGVGSTTVRWGESPHSGTKNYSDVDDTGIDLVNSLEAVFPTAGSLNAALLAGDRTEIWGQRSLLGRDWMPVSIWRVNGGNQLLNSLTFRYDSTHLTEPGETALQLLRWDGQAQTWNSVAATLYAANHRLLIPQTGTLTLGTPEYLAVAPPGWRWTGGTGSWIVTGNWSNLNGLPTGYPNHAKYPAWVTNGGTVTLNSGPVQAETLYLGYGPNVPLNALQVQSGGILQVGSLRLGVMNQNAQGKVELTGNGVLTADLDVIVGENGTGLVTQNTSEICSIGDSLIVAKYPTAFVERDRDSPNYELNPKYELKAGTLSVPKVVVGQEGVGILRLGEVDTASLTGVQQLIVREHLHADGLLEGWGTIGTTITPGGGQLINNGRIIANGFGTDRMLDLSGFYKTVDAHLEPNIVNSIENLPANGRLNADGTMFRRLGHENEPPDDTPNGWYAINHGKLKLPALYVSDPLDKYNWGESAWQEGTPSDWAHDIRVDLVNSVQVGNVVRLGPQVEIALLANDRETEDGVDQLWQAGYTAIGVWEFTPELPAPPEPPRSADLTFRYDHADSYINQPWAEFMPDPVWAQGFSEDTLRVAQYLAGRWQILGHQVRGGSVVHQITMPNVALSGTDHLVVVQQYPGDSDLSGMVDVFDVIDTVHAFGSQPGDPNWNAGCDYNATDVVDVFDVICVVNYFGDAIPPHTRGQDRPDGARVAATTEASGVADRNANGIPDACDVLRMAAETGAIHQLPAETLERLLNECGAYGW